MRFAVLLTLPVCFWLAAVSEPESLCAQNKAKTDSAKKEPANSPFVRAMRTSFKAWDKNNDGKLTVDEVDLAFKSLQVTGDAAVAIAVVKNFMRDHIDVQLDKGSKDPTKTCPPFSLEKHEARLAKGKKLPHDDLFVEFKRKLDNTPRALFPEKRPKLSAIKQGSLGDCFFMSMLGAFIHMHPGQLGQMIEEIDGKKSYLVRFPNRPKPTQIRAPSDAEIALNSTAEKNGLWLTVIEKAFAAEMHRRLPKINGIVGTELIAHGGACRDGVAVLTGYDMIDIEWNDPNLAFHLFRAVSQRCLIATAVREKTKPPAPLHTGHVYAVIGFDAAGQVTVYTSEGMDFTPQKGPPGLKNGYAIKSGVFTMPLRDYVAIFDGIICEDRTSKAHNPKKK